MEKKVVEEKVDPKSKDEKLKTKQDPLKRVFIVLVILVILEFCMIPGFIYAGMNQVFPIVMFLILPTLFAIVVLLLSRNTMIESKKKKEKLTLKKVSASKK